MVGGYKFTEPRNVHYRVLGCVWTSRLWKISWSCCTGASFTNNHNLKCYSKHTVLGNKKKKIGATEMPELAQKKIDTYTLLYCIFKTIKSQRNKQHIAWLICVKIVETFCVAILKRLLQIHFIWCFNESLKLLVRVRSQQWILRELKPQQYVFNQKVCINEWTNDWRTITAFLFFKNKDIM